MGTPKFRVRPVVTPKFRVRPVVTPKFKVRPVVTPKFKVRPVATPKFKVRPVATPKALASCSPGLLQPWVTKQRSETNAESVGERELKSVTHRVDHDVDADFVRG